MVDQGETQPVPETCFEVSVQPQQEQPAQAQPARVLSKEEMAALQMKRHERIQATIERVFQGEREEMQLYGFDNVQTQYWAMEAVEKCAVQLRQVETHTTLLTDQEQTMIIFDDTWLKLSMLMWTRDRKVGRTARKTPLAERNGPEWAARAMANVRKRKQIITRAGEAVCFMAGVGEDVFLYFRDNDVPTIMDFIDAVQLFIPAPVLSNVNRSKMVESLAADKEKTVTILADALESSGNIMRDFESALLFAEMKADDVQALQILLLEDILFAEHQVDMEDFKHTVMHHRILDNPIFVCQLRDGMMQVSEYFEDKFTESD